MVAITNNDNILCSYGCGNIAHFINQKGSYCCESSPNKCPAIKEKNRQKAIARSRNGFYKQDYIRKKISNSLKNSEKHKLASQQLRKPKIYHPGKCEVCGKDHDGTYGSGRFCCESCARKASSLNCDILAKNQKISLAFKSKDEDEKHRISMNAMMTYNKHHPELKKSLPYTRFCRCCGKSYKYKKQCIHPDICHFILTSKASLLKTYNFDFSTLGDESIYLEYDKLKQLLYTEYVVNQLSIPEITEKYNTDEVYLTWCLINRFKIPLRNISNSVQMSLLKGRGTVSTINNTNQYHQGWHITWNGETVFLRSSYELDFAKHLDELKVSYEVESIRIPYYCSYKNKIVVSISDFYVPSTNTIYEIKSDFTYYKQDIVDRFSMYINKGYIPILVLEHKEYDFNHLPEQRISKTIKDYFF